MASLAPAAMLPSTITGLDVRVIPFRRVAMVTSTDLLILGRRAVILWRGRYPWFDLLGHAMRPTNCKDSRNRVNGNKGSRSQRLRTKTDHRSLGRPKKRR